VRPYALCCTGNAYVIRQDSCSQSVGLCKYRLTRRGSADAVDKREDWSADPVKGFTVSAWSWYSCQEVPRLLLIRHFILSNFVGSSHRLPYIHSTTCLGIPQPGTESVVFTLVRQHLLLYTPAATQVKSGYPCRTSLPAAACHRRVGRILIKTDNCRAAHSLECSCASGYMPPTFSYQ